MWKITRLSLLLLCFVFMFVLSIFANANGRVVFLKWEDTGYQIATMNPDGEDVRILTEKIGSYENPRWSPNGRKIVYNELDAENQAYKLWIMNSDGSSLELISNSAYWGASWSPDSKKIAFMSTANRNIWIIDLQTREALRLVEGGVPVWSPDGKSIAYRPFNLPDDILYFINPVTGEKKSIDLTKRGIQILHKSYSPIAWSPDGKKIAFLGEEDVKAAWGLYIMDSDGTSVISKYTGSSIGLWVAGYPTWSPDGKQIMFNTPKGIEKMDTDGEVSTLVYDNGSYPDWQNSPNAPVISQEKAPTTWACIKQGR
jgi:Tol biopolymer transport system component